MNIPRKEHPKPQFERKNWLNLNGKWNFEIDNGKSGRARGLFKADMALKDSIIVPFCPQSELSTVNYKDFIYCAWYNRTVSLSEEQLKGRTFLHFGAVDYKAEVFINGKSIGKHVGGYVSFKFEVTEFVKIGKNVITVCAEDDERNPLIPRGKQSEEFFSHGCDYTRTTGIWQTVWLEFTPKNYIEKVKIIPNVNDGLFIIVANVVGLEKLKIAASFEGNPMGEIIAEASGNPIIVSLPLSEKHLWEPGAGRLYDIYFTFGDDIVHSYAGLRKIELCDKKFLLNGKSVFQRLVLDQGFYPDGIYTAPSDEALIRDIELSMSCGFNGARLHEKIFEERFLYHADRLGYMVWGEFPNWGLDHTRTESVCSILPEWLEEIERDFNHPSIIGWCPFNETWDKNGVTQEDRVLKTVYLATKAADDTRPCIDTSGFYHVKNCTDIYDVHDYEQNAEKFEERYFELFKNEKSWDQANIGYEPARQYYDCKKPLFISEYGGIGWNLNQDAWGYGNCPKSPEEFIERFRGLANALLKNPKIMGMCYTQLTDVEQEQNGLFTYDRKPKFPSEIFREILTTKAAIEE